MMNFNDTTLITLLCLSMLTESGRTDVRSSTNTFVFTPVIKSALQNLTIVDDDVLEFDELFIAEFDFGLELSNNWKVRKGEPSTVYCLIRDNDCELRTYLSAINEHQTFILLICMFLPIFQLCK